MKKILLSAVLIASTLFAADAVHEKKGFLTVASCADEGNFADCSLDRYKLKELVLFVHDEGKYYKVKAAEPKVIASLDRAFSQNEVTLFSTHDLSGGTLYVDKVTMPEQTKAPLFKGCL